MTEAASPVLLNVHQLAVQFGDKKVVHGISFFIRAGEKLALVGESGSGKTVSALALLRLVADAKISGAIDFSPNAESSEKPRDLLKLSERELRGLRGQEIAMIFQEPMTALNPLMTIGEQIAEVLALKQGLTRAACARATVQLLTDTGIAEPARRARAYPHQLSGGQRQRAMIAIALACRPQLLLADEPTTALDVTLRGQILDLLHNLQKQNGMAVLMITHDLNLVRKFADRVAVMEGGHIVEQGTVHEVFANPQHPYTQRLMDSRPLRDVIEVSDAMANQSTALPMLTAKHLQVNYPMPQPGIKGWFKKGVFVAVKNAHFQLAPGQTLGVVGESGSGKSTLALAVLGLQAFTGEIQLAGKLFGRDAAKNKALRRTVQVVFQDPFSSLSPRMTVEEIVGEGLRVHESALTVQERRSRCIVALTDVGLTEAQFPNLLQRYPHEFSGGQRQRIALARALIINPQLLVLDEPTSALDVTIQKQVLQLLQRLQRERGLAFLLITHDMDVIRAMAHHVLVMKDGQIIEEGSVAQVLDAPREAYTQRLMTAAL